MGEVTGAGNKIQWQRMINCCESRRGIIVPVYKIRKRTNPTDVICPQDSIANEQQSKN